MSKTIVFVTISLNQIFKDIKVFSDSSAKRVCI